MAAMADLLEINKRWGKAIVAFNQMMAEWAINNPQPRRAYGTTPEEWRQIHMAHCKRRNAARRWASEASGCDRIAAEYNAATGRVA